MQRCASCTPRTLRATPTRMSTWTSQCLPRSLHLGRLCRSRRVSSCMAKPCALHARETGDCFACLLSRRPRFEGARSAAGGLTVWAAAVLLCVANCSQAVGLFLWARPTQGLNTRATPFALQFGTRDPVLVIQHGTLTQTSYVLLNLVRPKR